MIQILIAILAGVVTIGAPCILPLLPILLGTSIGQTSKHRPLFIVLGFIITFTVVALLLSFLTTHLGLNPNTLRNLAIVLLALFGVFMIWPTPFEKLTTKLSGTINSTSQLSNRAGAGNFGGFVLGLTLGIIWTPCAGPVLGSILTLIATSADTTRAGILLFAYAIGAAIPMLLIATGSQYITTKVRFLAQYAKTTQQIFGVLIILLAIAMYFQYDIVFQQYLLQHYPSFNPNI